MKKKLKDRISDKLVNAFLKNKIIAAIPKKFTKKLTEADKFRKLCESKIKEPIIQIIIALIVIFVFVFIDPLSGFFIACSVFIIYYKFYSKVDINIVNNKESEIDRSDASSVAEPSKSAKTQLKFPLSFMACHPYKFLTNARVPDSSKSIGPAPSLRMNSKAFCCQTPFVFTSSLFSSNSCFNSVK